MNLRESPYLLRLTPLAEAAHRARFARDHIDSIRIAILAGSALFLLFGFVDATLPGVHRGVVTALRYVAFPPLALIALGSTYIPGRKGFVFHVVAATLVIAGAKMSAMMAITPWPHNVVYYVGVLVALLYVLAVAPLPFDTAAISAAVITAVFCTTTLVFRPMPALHSQAAIFTAVAFLIAGTLGMYRRHRFERIAVHARHDLAIGNARLQSAGEKLEHRVNERTQSLSEVTEELRCRLAEREALLREIHHRVYNNLQLIGSLVGLQMERTVGTGSDQGDALTRIESQVNAMTVAHRALYAGDGIAAVSLGGLLDAVLAQRNRSWTIACPDRSIEAASITPEQVVPIALVVSELLQPLEGEAGGGVVVVEGDRRSGTITVACEPSHRTHGRTTNPNPTDRAIVESLATQAGGWCSAGPSGRCVPGAPCCSLTVPVTFDLTVDAAAAAPYPPRHELVAAAT